MSQLSSVPGRSSSLTPRKRRQRRIEIDLRAERTLPRIEASHAMNRRQEERTITISFEIVPQMTAQIGAQQRQGGRLTQPKAEQRMILSTNPSTGSVSLEAV